MKNTHTTTQKQTNNLSAAPTNTLLKVLQAPLSRPPHPLQPTFLKVLQAPLPAHPTLCSPPFYSQWVAYSSTCKYLNIILFKSALYYNSFEFTPFAGFLPKAKPPINVVGDVAGKIAIIIVSF